MAAPFPTPTPTWHDTSYSSISPTLPALSAAGKNILITGGGSGVGAETARSFAIAGASRIALLGRRENVLLETKASIEKASPRVQVFIKATDVTNKTQVDEAFAQFAAFTKGEPINVLVACAAVTGPHEALRDVDCDKFLGAVETNMKMALYVSKAFLQYAAKDAVAVEINSNAAHVNYSPMFTAYSVAKLAVYRLWDSVGFAHPEMSVFHVQPGVVDTDMNKEVGGVEAVGFEDHVSLPANFSLWLASPEARFLKGKYLWANWDVDELKAQAKEIEEGWKLNIQLVGWPFDKAGWTAGWKFEK